jgi:uncharacterized protein YjbI with pentapeptide repeats
VSEQDERRGPMEERDRLGLRADCASCFGLCCVALPFSASADFAIDKDAGQPCTHLSSDFRCVIHHRLRQQGFPGCVAYDCFGAGQQVSQGTFGGRDWRGAPEHAARMFEVFPIMRQLHELLWYLAEALSLRPAAALHREIRAALDATERLTRGDAAFLVEHDLTAHRRDVRALLLRTSELVRAQAVLRRTDRDGLGRRGQDLRGQDLRGQDLRGQDLRGQDLGGADLIGADLERADLRGANLSSAYFIGADLSGADLRMADLLGADLRGAELSGADLGGSIFVTQSQLGAANGDTATRLPPALVRPAHWRHVNTRADHASGRSRQGTARRTARRK